MTDTYTDTAASTWKVEDLSKFWYGEIPRIAPDIGRIDNGLHLFYSGAVNMLFGDSTAGKSWVCLYIAAQQVALKHHVIYIDLESNGRSVISRLKAFGVDPTLGNEYFKYITVGGAYGHPERAEIEGLADAVKPTLAVVDTMGEALAVDGLSSKDDADIVKWMRSLPQPLAKKGICVIEVDHIGVGDTAGGRVTGSFRKRAAITGATYQAKQDEAFPHAKGQKGYTILTCKKDREGWFANDEVVAVFSLEDDDYGRNAKVALTEPSPDQKAKKKSKAKKDPVLSAVDLAYQVLVEMGATAETTRRQAAVMTAGKNIDGKNFGSETLQTALNRMIAHQKLAM